MDKISPFKQSFLGWVTALIIIALIFTAGVAVAQWELDPEDVVSILGQSGDADLSAVDTVNSVASGGALQVFQTVATYNGSGPAGYGRSGMHAGCRAEDPDSHFCTLQEIENAWKTSGVDFVLVGQAWVDNAVVGTIDSGYSGDFTIVSDWYGGSASGDYPYNCNAWTNSTNTARGLIMNDGAISPATEACDDIHPIACCK